MEEDKILIGCSCGCSVLDISKLYDDGDEVYISHYYSSFYTKQNGWFDRLKDKIRFIWCIIANKEYYFYEVILKK